MITYDDLEPSEKIKVYDKGVSFTDDPKQIQEMRVGYRTGDMWAPKLIAAEALATEGEHFVDCIVATRCPRPTGNSACASSNSSRPPASRCGARCGATVKPSTSHLARNAS